MLKKMLKTQDMSLASTVVFGNSNEAHAHTFQFKLPTKITCMCDIRHSSCCKFPENRCS